LQPDFDEARKRVAAGRAYAKGSPTGEIRWTSGVVADSPLATTVIVPQDYDPDRRYGVRVFLHGGVARPAPEEQQARPQSNPRRRRLESDIPLLYVYPSGFAEAQWWFANQVDSIAATLDHLKRVYNVDENRVHLMGVSDGGTGVYFFGLREATPWSVLFPFNGFLRVLTNPAVGADGEFFIANLTNKPLYIVTAGATRSTRPRR
jgi:predicted esterase